MPSLHSQWLRIAEQLRDATNQLDLAVSGVLAKVATGINPKAVQLEAISVARKRVHDVRALMDSFLDQHLRDASGLERVTVQTRTTVFEVGCA